MDPSGYTSWKPPSFYANPPIVSRSKWGAWTPGVYQIDLGLAGRICYAGCEEGIYDSTSNPAGYAFYSALLPCVPLEDILDSVVIHHEGNNPSYDVQTIQREHMLGNRWTDIGYHFIVAPDGTIYEGRSIGARGSHVAGENTGRIGILIMGDFQPGPTYTFLGLTVYRDDDDPGPTNEQVQSTMWLIRWLDYQYGIEEVLGHRDLNPTECPGDYCVPYVSMFNQVVQGGR